jgi:hypothetical protein
MFVNVSPADYNRDETVVSLTYAARVKLITNDAQKNADNKEVRSVFHEIVVIGWLLDHQVWLSFMLHVD